MKIMLVRHGQTFWNILGKMQGTSNVHLSPDGLHQARLLAAHCPFHTADAIYSSPLSRAEDTAVILANKFNLHVQFIPELRETNFGDWEGQTLREIAEKEPENFEKFFMQPDELKIPNGETFQQCQVRAMEALKKIIDKHSSDKKSHIIVVAHGAVNRVILCSLLDIPLRKMWSLAQFNTAVNIIHEEEGNFTIELVNGTSHLA